MGIAVGAGMGSKGCFEHATIPRIAACAEGAVRGFPLHEVLQMGRYQCALGVRVQMDIDILMQMSIHGLPFGVATCTMRSVVPTSAACCIRAVVNP
jgi:hypothetical protein